MKPDFGYSYPPGAQNDPRAPYNDPGYDDSGDLAECECGESALSNGLCLRCNHEEALLARWERRRDE